MNSEFWNGRRVLLTGHTGFKGGWLAHWLVQMGAKVTGISLAPETDPNLFELTQLEGDIEHHIFDIVDAAKLNAVFAETQPEIVLHLAAQPLVRRSYRDPIETFSSNAMGTVTLLDAVRKTPSVTACVIVTSDKCYENNEWVWGYRETDAMGGHDPYSASKGVSELITSSMRRSFFKPHDPKGHDAKVGSGRAGNVIGGGDFSEDRLVPDIVRGCLGMQGSVELRNPVSLRPWQHVLEPIRGYLMLAERLAEGDEAFAEGWNFGPTDDDTRTVEVVADALVAEIGQGEVIKAPVPDAPHEANLLRLDCAKAHKYLRWLPMLDFDDTIRMTAQWYKAWSDNTDMRAYTLQQLNEYRERTQ